MKTTKEKIEIMQAYERGEKIEFKRYDGKWQEDKKWYDVCIPAWDWLHADYRVKSEFHDGDILFLETKHSWIFIFKQNENKEYIYNYVAVPAFTTDFSIFITDSPLCFKENVSKIRLATDEEKQRLFDCIKANGYHWDAETKTLEKLVGPKFKVGDIVQHDDYKVRITEVNTDDNLYGYESLLDLGIGSIPFNKQDCWELAPNKFDPNDLKPFANRVLVRNADGESWIPALYVSSDPKSKGCYALIYRDQCIPYKGNEYLSGKTNNCDDFYKTWE